MRFDCVVISRVTVEVEIPDGQYYDHMILDKAVHDKLGDQLKDMLLKEAYMQHYSKRDGE